MKEHRFKYEWNLKDAIFTKDKGNVFSCFACGGGSTMGYKLAGFNVIGHNDIDPKMIEVYKENHNPKYSFLESITTFAKRKDLPKELYNLEVLDGSPPCSSFSMVGNREKDWGKEKKFREGQQEQVLDTLFFDFIDLAKELQPKVVVAENVKGLLLGEAKKYVIEIYKSFEEAGYVVQHFLLNSSFMGVPQMRERVFFIALRKDLCYQFMKQVDFFTQQPELKLEFDEKKIPFKNVYHDMTDRPLSPKIQEVWNVRQLGYGDMSTTNGREFNRPNSFFSYNYIYKERVCNTIVANDQNVLFDEPRFLNKIECCRIGSYPLDYNFLKIKPQYLIGMSVPPVIVANIATEIYNQWLSKIK